MTWLVPALKLLAFLFDTFAGWGDEGTRKRAEQALAGTRIYKRMTDALIKAKDARARVERDIARDSGGVRDDDGFRRD
jgi:hypothetical protein